jgi:hypothetical protein
LKEISLGKFFKLDALGKGMFFGEETKYYPHPCSHKEKGIMLTWGATSLREKLIKLLWGAKSKMFDKKI